MFRNLIVLGLLVIASTNVHGQPCSSINVAPTAYAPAAPVQLPICCDRCIDYVVLRPRLQPCGPTFETTLLVKDAWACCYVPVKMCLPACCTGEPEICAKGKHVVEYTWCSGYKVRVILTKHGKVFVHYNA